MKKILSLVLAVLMLATVLCACSPAANTRDRIFFICFSS